MSKFWKAYDCPYDERYAMFIEDDGRVAYAYLYLDGKIISDIWLYNQSETPEIFPWTSKKNMPFLNPKQFIIIEKMISPIKSEREISLQWIYENDLDGVNILINNELIAVLKPYYCPGFSTLVCQDGPLAKKLEMFQRS